MKVLFVQNIEGIAGSEKYFIQLIPKLKEKGLEVEFLGVYLPDKKEAFEEFAVLLEEAGVKYQSFEAKKYYSPRLLPKIRKFIQTNNFDIVHSHLIYADFWLGMLKRMGRLKDVITVSTLHGYQEKIYVDYCLKPEELPNNLYFKIARFSYKYIDHVYACSYGLKEFYDRSKIQFKNGVDVIQHGFAYPEIDEKHEENDRIALSIIGRVIPRKGHMKVLQNFKQVIDQFPNVLLRIVGDGTELDSLKMFVKEKGLESHVEFTGFQSNVHYYYQNSDIILVPSIAEGLPLVIFEAYNHAKPVVAFRTIGPAEAIQDEKTGYLIEPFDEKMFLDRVMQLMNDNDAQKKFGKAAKELLDSHFTIDRMVEETYEYYQKIRKK